MRFILSFTEILSTCPGLFRLFSLLASLNYTHYKSRRQDSAPRLRPQKAPAPARSLRRSSSLSRSVGRARRSSLCYGGDKFDTALNTLVLTAVVVTFLVASLRHGLAAKEAAEVVVSLEVFSDDHVQTARASFYV